jgi:hypothetical protein
MAFTAKCPVPHRAYLISTVSEGDYQELRAQRSSMAYSKPSAR